MRALIALDGDVDAQVAALRRFRDLAADAAALRAPQALDAHLDGASVRDTAEALFVRELVAAQWYRGTPLRDQTRHLIRRGRQLMDGGYRDLLTGRLPRVTGDRRSVGAFIPKD